MSKFGSDVTAHIARLMHEQLNFARVPSRLSWLLRSSAIEILQGMDTID